MFNTKVKGVTFDFGGTLALGGLDKEGFRHDLLEYLRSLGFSGSESLVNKTRDGMLGRLMKARDHNREIRLEDLYQDMLFKLGLHPEREVTDFIHQLYIRSFKVELIPGVEKILELLNVKYRLAIISNATSNVPREAMKRFGLEKYFDSIVISRDIGIRKPDPEIFNFTLKNLGIKSDEAVHVGDSLEYDVRGAKNAGMRAVWIKRNNEEENIQPDYTIHSLQELTLLL
ncbi:MAG: HAD family hydrolase [archaeon]|nr:HAD family hydrolase [archaeon]